MPDASCPISNKKNTKEYFVSLLTLKGRYKNIKYYYKSLYGIH